MTTGEHDTASTDEDEVLARLYRRASFSRPTHVPKFAGPRRKDGEPCAYAGIDRG